MHLSNDEASRALAAVEASRQAMRAAVRGHRGHLYFWLWGVAWIVMALTAQLLGMRGVRLMPWISAVGIVGTFIIRSTQRGQLQAPVDRRFIGLLVAIFGFGFIWPLVLGAPPNPQAMFAYTALLTMFGYVAAGIWFDVYLLWVGLAVSTLILVGLLFFFPIFWWWIAVFGGGSLIATGFYVRNTWR